MFEGLLYQLLSGYLGNYVKDIQREKLRIGLWSGYVLLENVELRVEAFDYLQLPFAVKQGSIGKLRLQVPWKKLGWEPILIALEDVYICFGPRDDTEWDPEALEKRELAAKRAKLAAAELEKLSQRVSDEKLQRSFLTHISARIIDNIQVAIGNVHIRYANESAENKAKFSLGLTLAELTVNNVDGRSFPSSGVAVAGKQKNYLAHKIVKIQKLAVYWNSQPHQSSVPQKSNEDRCEALFKSILTDEDEAQYLLNPMNATAMVTVNRNRIGEVGAPQYATFINVDDLKLRWDDHQHQEFILLQDSLRASKSREKYGRYRPHNAKRRGRGWAKLWWQYSIEAVLSDVQERQRRSSRMFFNWCMEQRKIYVDLYKEKLECLQQGHPIGEVVVEQLDEIEKKLDMDMILYCRILAEKLLHSKNASIFEKKDTTGASFETNTSGGSEDQVNECVSHIPRGWKSWLSLGMLGESGTIDTSRLSVSFSEDIIKDLYEATNFDPSSTSDWQDWPKGYNWLAVSLHLGQVAGTLHSMSSKTDVACCLLEGAVMNLRVWKESASLTVSLKSMEVVDPSSQSPLYPYLLSSKSTSICVSGESTTASKLMRSGSESSVPSVGSLLRDGKSSPAVRVDIEIYFLHHKDLDMTITVNLSPIDFIYNSNALISLSRFFGPSKPSQGVIYLEALEAHPHLQTELVFPSLRRVALQVHFERPTIAFLEKTCRSGGALMVVTLQYFRISSSNHKNGADDLSSGSSKVAFCSSSFDASHENFPFAEGDIQDHHINKKIHGKNASMNKFQLLVKNLKVIISSHSRNWQEKLHSFEPSLTFIDTFDMKATMYAYHTKSCPVSLRLKVGGSVPLLRVSVSTQKFKLLDALVSDMKLAHQKVTSDQQDLSEEHSYKVCDNSSRFGSESCNAQYPHQRTATADVKMEDFHQLDINNLTSTGIVAVYISLKAVVVELNFGSEKSDITSNPAGTTWVTKLEEVQLKYIQDPWQNKVHLLIKDLHAQNDMNYSGGSSLLNSILEISGTQFELDILWNDWYSPSNTMMHQFVPDSFLRAENSESPYCSNKSLMVTANCFAETVHCSIKSLNEDNILLERCNAKSNSVCIKYFLKEGCHEIWTVNFLALSLFHVELSGHVPHSGKTDDCVDIRLLQPEDENKSSKKQISELLSCIYDDDKDGQAQFKLLNYVNAKKDIEFSLPLTKISVLMRQWNEVASGIQSIIPLFNSDMGRSSAVNSEVCMSLEKYRSPTSAYSSTSMQNICKAARPKLPIPVTERSEEKYLSSFDSMNNDAHTSFVQVKINIPDVCFLLKDFTNDGSFAFKGSEQAPPPLSLQSLHEQSLSPFSLQSSHPVGGEDIDKPECNCASQKCVLIAVSVFVDKILLTSDKVFLEARIPKLEASFDKESQKERSKVCFLRASSITIKGEVLGGSATTDLFLVLHADLVETWFSNQILHFWLGFNFEPLEGGPSLLINVELRVDAHIESGSLLVTDARWSRNTPILEVILENAVLSSTWRLEDMETSLAANLRINYHNPTKVAWEPLLETWCTRSIIAKYHKADMKYTARPYTKIEVSSSDVLNINITDGMVQAILSFIEMIEDSWTGSSSHESNSNVEVERKKSSSFAPYWFQNETGVAVTYWLVGVCQEKDQYHNFIEPICDKKKLSDYQHPIVVEPGCAVPILIEEREKHICYSRKSACQTTEVAEWQTISHRQMCFQLEGASRPSPPMPIDLVGCRSFEVVFSNTLGPTENSGNFSETNKDIFDEDEDKHLEKPSFFSTHAVLEVTEQGYSKLIKLHSKVCLVNATSKPLEVRFDIPFGVSPKVLDLVMPGQTTFLPVHLAETGKIRWRPYGNSHLWSETQSLADMIFSFSHYRPSVCYPVHPNSNGPFRCCLNASQSHLSTKPDFSGSLFSETTGILEGDKNEDCKTESTQASYSYDIPCGFKDQSESCGIFSLTLIAPLLITNLLTCSLEISIESKAASNLSLSAPREGSVYVYDIDVSHNLCINISAPGYLPSSMKFDRATFLTEDAHLKSHYKTTFSVCESMTLQPETISGSPLRVNLEKIVDITSGARKLDITVPYWLYNCTHLDMVIKDADVDVPFGKEIFLFGTASYDSYDTESNVVFKRDAFLKVVGLQAILGLDKLSTQPHNNYVHERRPSSKISSHLPSCRVHTKEIHDICASENRTSRYCVQSLQAKMFIHDSRDRVSHETTAMPDSQMYFNGPLRDAEVVPHMYSPEKGSEMNENRLRARFVLPGHVSPVVREPKETIWSRPFSLDFPTGVTTMLIPNLTKRGACVVSVSSVPFKKAQTGKTKIVTFQPRYVLANACKRDLLFKQQGTERFQLLSVGNYSHLHWDDVSRNLLVSVRYDEHGWDWSGGFAPNVLGDTQVKMHNYVTGIREMIRVEVTIANAHPTDEAYVAPASVNHGTCLIVITNDETGFMPYRIENFTMEKLRFYQQKCDKMENVLYAYSSCDYAWDEPCQPHQLVIEIPGQGSLGAYGVENIKKFSAVTFPARAEAPERRFLVSVRAEGPKRVLSVTDVSIHDEEEFSSVNQLFNADRNTEPPKNFAEEYSINLACIGFSLVDSSPQEIVYASAKGVLFHFQKDQDQQKVTFQIESFQVDNQLRHAAYPVLLSTCGSPKLEIAASGNENNTRVLDNRKISNLERTTNVAFKAVITKWQQAAGSVDCYQCIYARISPVMLELEDRILISLFAFMKTSLSLSMRKKRRLLVRQRPDVENLGSEVAEKHNGNSLWSFTTSNLTQNRWRTHIAVDHLAIMIQKQVLIAKEKRKVYIEVLHIEPIDLTVSFSSAPWSTKQHQISAQKSLLWTTGTLRHFIALADVEGAPVYLGRLMLTHPMANWNAIIGIISRHYTRQLVHEFYKVLGSADLFGNPMGFLSSLRLGIWDFFSSPTRSIIQNPKELAKGLSEGTKSLLNNTIFAFSNAASQMSKAAQKGVAAFVLDQDYIAELERHQQEQWLESSIVNEFLEGLTGFLKLSVRGAEKHGLPGIFSGAAVGALGAIARPAASMLELSKKTFQSIRNRTMPFHRQRVRVRLPRRLNGNTPLRPYSWDEAVGMAVLLEADRGRFQNEIFVSCKKLIESTKFVVLTKKRLLRVRSTALAAAKGEAVSSFGPEWHIELEAYLEDALHVDLEGVTMNIIFGQQRSSLKRLRRRGVFSQKVATPSVFKMERFEFLDATLAGEFLVAVKHQVDRQKSSLSNLVFSSTTLSGNLNQLVFRE